MNDFPPTETTALRNGLTGAYVRLSFDGDRIDRVEPASKEMNGVEDLWVAPAFWDIQTNGRWGVSFSDCGLTVEQVVAIVRAHSALGVARLCPTLITSSAESTRHGVATIAEACDRYPDVAQRVIGIHLEGPYISDLDGYRGAHPIEHTRDPDWDEFKDWREASGKRIRLVTLAPERTGAIAFIRRLRDAGVVVAMAHTAATGEQLNAAVEAGASLSTHLGNGIAATLPRHPNAIWQQAADDRLWASLIADGHHLSTDVLRVLVRAKTVDRLILVSDASPLAGLPVGRYGPWGVDPTGKIVVADSPYLAGSNQAMDTGINQLLRGVGLSLSDALRTATENPARLLGIDSPQLAPGASADLLFFRYDPTAESSFRMVGTRIAQNWTEADPNLPPPTGWMIQAS